MTKFKERDIVYHKVTGRRGVISRKSIGVNPWVIVWDNGKRGAHTEDELYTEEEYKKKDKPMSSGNEERKLNWQRIGFAIFYLVIFITIIVIFNKKIFKETEVFYNFYRLLWCFAITCLGFAVIVFRGRYKPKSPFPEYVTYYLFLILVIPALVFSILYWFKISGFPFFTISFVACSILGYLIDYFWEIIIPFIKIIREKLGKLT